MEDSGACCLQRVCSEGCLRRWHCVTELGSLGLAFLLVTKCPPDKSSFVGKWFVLDQGWKIESMLVGEMGGGWSHGFCSQEAERDECFTHVLLLIQFGALACRMVLPTFRV